VLPYLLEKPQEAQTCDVVAQRGDNHAVEAAHQTEDIPKILHFSKEFPKHVWIASYY